MTTLDLVLYLLGAFGFAYIAGHSAISLPTRTWLGGIPAQYEPVEGKAPRVVRYAVPGALGSFGEFLVALVECPACLGFWIGLASGNFLPVPGWLPPWGWVIWCGLLTSGSNFLLGRLTRLI